MGCLVAGCVPRWDGFVPQKGALPCKVGIVLGLWSFQALPSELLCKQAAPQQPIHLPGVAQFWAPLSTRMESEGACRILAL